MHPLVKILQKQPRTVIGLMSGTSLDGVDTAIVDIEGNGLSTRWKLIAFDIFEYPSEIKDRLFQFAVSTNWDADELCRLNFWLGTSFAQAVKRLCKKRGIAPDRIDLIGSHGQTIRHLPEPADFAGIPVAATLQIGEPSVIAKITGIPTVADFRPADMALGGQGAPLVPLVDYMLFRSDITGRGMLNIGGISNITVIPAKARPQNVFAFDTGPGNMIIDRLTQRLFNLPMDKDGGIASKGKIHRPLIDDLLKHPYLKIVPPKSTGRETFGDIFINKILDAGRELKLNKPDILATATAFVAISIRDAYRRYIRKITILDEIYVSGGGANNPVLFEYLGKYLQPIRLFRSDAAGIPVDAKEAICFAILANETISGNAGNLPGVTGARKECILGKICL